MSNPPLQVGLVFFVDYPRTRLLGGRAGSPFLSGAVGTVTFDVTKHVLDIVYSQTICWLALFYAPLIVVVTLLKSFLVFYIRLFYVLKVLGWVDASDHLAFMYRMTTQDSTPEMERN